MISHSSFARACFMAAVVSFFAVAPAQQPNVQNPDDAAQRRPRRAPGTAPEGGPPGMPMPGPMQGAPRPPVDSNQPIDDVVKDCTKMSGVVTLYRQKKGTADTLYMEVPESALGKLMLLQVTSGSGLGDTTNAMVFHGMPIDDIPFRIEKVDDGRLIFVRPNLAHRSTVAEVNRMIDRSFPNEILGSFDIRARQPERKSYLIEVGSFFKSDVSDLSATIEGGGMGYAFNPAQTYIDQLKVFPENAVVRTVYGLSRRGPAGSTPKSVTWAVSYNLSALPENDGYRPRLGDPRVGYFTQSYENLDDQSSREKTVNYIERWNLQKADPNAPLSPPKKPIVFYIDNAVPVEYRDDVRTGILMWNKAFEKVGIKDAIQVKQMPDDADWDIADLRYNVVRWTTGMPFAIALMRANPMTGEILNACINFDGVFAMGASSEYQEVVNPSIYYDQKTIKLPGKYADRLCDMQESSAQVAAEGENLFEALQTPAAPFNRDAYVHQRLVEVVAHEMGHCLGLRHNFIASTQISMQQLADPDYVKAHGTSASVMDYVPYNVAALKKKDVPYYQTTVGDYDLFAIQYGYTPVKADTPQGELFELRQIASKGSLPGHRYMSDGTADDYDPAIVRYDMASDPLAWAKRTMEVSQYLLRTAAARRVQKGQSYYEFTRSWNGALSSYFRAAAYVPRFIGGVNLSDSFAGDPDGTLPITPVSAARQRTALNLLNTYIFSESAFDFPASDLAKLTFDPNTANNEAAGRSRLFPMRSSFSTFQTSTLRRVFAPDVLNRVANNEFRTHDTLTLAQLFNSVNASIWSELSTGREISPLRRQLQRDDLSLLCDFVVKKDASVPDDARTLAFAQLQDLRGRIAAAKPAAKGEYGKAHLAECLAQIDQALHAQVQVSEAAPAPTFPGRRNGETP